MESKLIVRSGFTDNIKLWKSILQDLIDNGFTLVGYNGTATTTVPPTELTSFVVDATDKVDPTVADKDNPQPWRIAVKVTVDTTQVYCASPAQITTAGIVSKTGISAVSGNDMPNYAGQIGARCISSYITSGQNNKNYDVYFWHRGTLSSGSVDYNGTMDFPSSTVLNSMQNKSKSSLISADPLASPFTYHLSITDHGVALHMQVEGSDNMGCRAAWFVIQRAINSDGTVVSKGKAPLFCMYSVNGGGSALNDSTIYDLSNSNGAYQIMRFTVRESDVNVPTVPVPAYTHSADSFAVINPFQMVAFSEDNHFDFRLPQGFNTQRYSYPYEMDMVGYASADVISNGTEVAVQVYGETEDDKTTPKKRAYKALTANSPNNTGMRIFLLKGYAPKEDAEGAKA